jgi:serine/threonine protein kinase
MTSSPDHSHDDSLLDHSKVAVLRSLKRDLLAEQQSRGVEDRPASPEELLPRWPTEPRADADVASLLFENLLQRRAIGEEPSLDEYSQQFPEHKDSLAGLFSNQNFLRSISGDSRPPRYTLRFPEVGDELCGFRFRAELGRGAFARVFLAEQIELAGRAVAVKVSAREGNEPQTLAQMQHTHIVPIYAVQEDQHSGLRAVCMPYFGGASLSRVLQELWDGTTVPLQGQQLADALQRVQIPTALEEADPSGNVPACLRAQGGRTPLALFRGESYVRAVAWIVARLAEGLEHAHQRGVLHRDIKPSNILLGADGQPMLLDFNLSQNQNGDPAEAVLGGTVAYMAPEHLRAMSRRTPALASQVDHRSDIYSLGMVLDEMLAGKKPFEQSASYSVLPLQLEAMAAERSKGALSVRSLRPDVPWSLESILRKCLAPQPADRYQQAEQLAEDLRCLLEDRTLQHAPELSRVERVVKWTRRHPRLTSAGSVTLVAGLLLLAAGTALGAVRRHLAGTQEELGLAQAEQRKRAIEAGTVQALCLVKTTVGPQDHLPQGAKVCQDTLALYDLLTGDTWQEPGDWCRLSEKERRRLAEDTRELLVLLAAARVRLRPTDPSVLRQALGLLDRAEAIPGLSPSRALWLDRARFLDALGETRQARAAREKAEGIRVATARDHYLLATALTCAGSAAAFTQALAELDKALVLDPRHYWSWLQRGICHTELGELILAAGDFGQCTGLWPEFAWGQLKAIEALTTADRVWAFDFRRLEWRLSKVLQTFTHDYDGPMVTLDLGGERIVATGGHPFWVIRGESLSERPALGHLPTTELGGRQEGRWVLAEDLRAGDELLLRSGERATITATSVEESRVLVYNIHVAELENYVVGNRGVLVHNTNKPPRPRIVPNERNQWGPAGPPDRLPPEPPPAPIHPKKPIQGEFAFEQGGVKFPIPTTVEVPSVKGGAFHRWFNSLTAEQIRDYWRNPAVRAAIEDRLRSPGGFHEWLPVSRAPKFREWGITAEQIHELRSRFPGCVGKSVGKCGPWRNRRRRCRSAQGRPAGHAAC